MPKRGTSKKDATSKSKSRATKPLKGQPGADKLKARKRATSTKRKTSPSQKPAAESPTFMGRRVVTIEWRGEKVQAVEGRFAYRHKERARFSRSEAERKLGVQVHHSSQTDLLDIGVIQSEPSVPMVQTAKAGESDPDVLWCEPVMLHEGCFRPNDSLFSQQWALREINFERGLELYHGDSSTVVIAILDTGIAIEAGRLSHTDMDDPNRFLLGPDLVNRDNDPSDDHGHGTHIAGIAAATTDNNRGIAGLWPGPIFVVKVNDVFNRGSDENFRKGIIEAVRFASLRRARLIINYSSAGPDTEQNRAAVEFAASAGALVVAAVGNNFGSIKFPAAYSTQLPNVIAVGAVDEQRRRPDFANRGSQMTVVAPGVGILSTLPNYFVLLNNQGKQPKYDVLDGTSQATPFVSALAALVWSQWPNLTAQQVRDKVANSATSIPGPQNDFGHGIIDVEKALT